MVDIELSSWKHKWLECDEKMRPKTIASSLKKSSREHLSVLLKPTATLPVTSCERSFSILRHLRTWLRTYTTTNTLSSLEIINIHHGVQIDYKLAVKIFLELGLRKLHASNLIFYEE